jgi:cytochrome c oxidase subunit 2
MTDKYYGWGLPINISAQGAPIDQLIYVLHIFMALLFVGWFIYLIYALIRFRNRPGHKAAYKLNHFKTPTYIEVGVAIFEAVLLVGFSFPVLHQVRDAFPPADEALQVRVVAEQFAWNFHYPGADGIFGKTDIKLIDAVNPVGLDTTDPAAKDDIVAINQLHVPVNRKVIARLSSKDVIHSFGIPVMRVKRDVVPGQTASIWFEAEKAGNFEIACAQLCGLGHYRMRGFFTVESEEAFNQWLAELAPKPEPPFQAAPPAVVPTAQVQGTM